MVSPFQAFSIKPRQSVSLPFAIPFRVAFRTGRYTEVVAHPKQTRKLLRTLWYLAIFTVVVASLLPNSSLPLRILGRLHLSDKVEHCVAYVVLAFLPAIHEGRRFIIVAALGAVGLGVALEFGQILTGRDFEYRDMVADTVGVCLGLAAGIPLRSTEVARSVLFGE